MSGPLEVMIVTTAHHPEDGRLVRHQRALRRAGMRVHLVAIKSSSRWGRFSTGPWRARRAIMRSRAACVILPDPELQLVLPPTLPQRIGVISDVHEDYLAVTEDRRWVRRGLKPVVRSVVHAVQWVRKRYSDVVVVADPRLDDHDAVPVTNRPNPCDLPRPRTEPAAPRLVYVGDIRPSRGSDAMLDLVAGVAGVDLDLVGPCQDPTALRNRITALGLDHRVTWHDRLGYAATWEIAATALAGLSLLSHTPAFSEAVPTKIWEYWAVGLPVLASDLPGQRRIVEAAQGGVVGDASHLRTELSRWIANPALARQIGSKGRDYYAAHDDGSEARLVAAVQSALDRTGREERRGRGGRCR